jgi:hypothetical protein
LKTYLSKASKILYYLSLLKLYLLNSKITNRVKHARVGLILSFLFFCFFTSFAQNTKGDRSVSNQQQVKESRARIKDQNKNRTASYRKSVDRLRSQKNSPSYRANNVYPQTSPYAGRKSKGGDKPGKPIGPVFNSTSGGGKDKVWKGNDQGKQIRLSAKRAEKARTKSNVYPQPTEYKRYLAKQSREKGKDRPWQGNDQGKEIRLSAKRAEKIRSQRNVYQQPAEYKKYLAKQSRRKEKSWRGDATGSPIVKRSPKSGKSQAALRTASGDLPIRMTPRQSEQFQSIQPAFGGAYSVTHSFIIRRKKNVYWGKFRKGEKPFLKDIAGLRLRRKNYSTKPPPLTPQQLALSNGRSASNPNLTGGVGLGTPTKRDKAWLGDPNKSKLRKSEFRNNQKVGSNPYIVTESQSKKLAKKNAAIPANGVLSISGRKGVSKQLPARYRGDVGASYSGNLKGTKYSQGFDPSVLYSGFIKRKNLPAPSPQGADFRGNTKGFKNPLKGGGSISGQLRNNKNKSVTDKYIVGHDISHSYAGFIKGKFAHAPFAPQGENFSGDLKTSRPEKGGGSISGIPWNNKRQSITKLRNHAYQGFDFAGNAKTSKPEKGGSSISGGLWNNKEKSITRLRNHAYQGFDFAGNIKATKPQKGGESISGQMWNNNEKPIAGTYANKPRASTATSGKIQLSRFRKDYIQSPHANIASALKRRPLASALAVNEFKPKTKLKREYVHNPKSAALALKVLSQPKAYAQIGDFQGNKKMWKSSSKNLHPDAQFAHLGQSNVKQDRTIMTNIKLIWAKMFFKKNETQPKAAKPDEHPLRYDRKEKDIWKALYDYNEYKGVKK